MFLGLFSHFTGSTEYMYYGCWFLECKSQARTRFEQAFGVPFSGHGEEAEEEDAFAGMQAQQEVPELVDITFLNNNINNVINNDNNTNNKLVP